MDSSKKTRHKNEVVVTSCLFVLLTLLLEITGVTPALMRALSPWIGISVEARGAVAGLIAPFLGIAIYGVVRAISKRMR